MKPPFLFIQLDQFICFSCGKTYNLDLESKHWKDPIQPLKIHGVFLWQTPKAAWGHVGFQSLFEHFTLHSDKMFPCSFSANNLNVW